MTLNVHLLGPVEVVCGDQPVVLGGSKPRALLAMLALDTGSTVSTDRLVDGLWGEQPPASASKLVQVYVSQLRKAFGGAGIDGVIVTHGHGYQLAVSRTQVDATRFERLLAQGEPRRALTLWRGSPLANVALEPFAGPEIRRLTELHAAAVEVAIDQDLEAGRHREVLPELESLLGQEPLRERLHAQRILALYRAGRQADALEAYRHTRALLINDVGVEPGPELRRLHEALLRQDPSLEAPQTPRALAPSTQPVPQNHDAMTDLAVRAGKVRGEWQIVEDDLAAGLVAQQTKQRRTAAPAHVVDPHACPYMGLASFGPDDADVFFGRERLVAEIVARLPGSRLIGIVGASGSGKSSLLHAGVLPALTAGVLPGSDSWTSTVLRPGAHPRAVLQDAVDRLPAVTSSVLVVDQFEEVFTACNDEAERTSFIDRLVECARDHRRRTVVVLALRADFYGHCAGYPELSRMLDSNTVLVGPMRAEELRNAIEGPAQATGLPVEPPLIEALVADVEGEPGALPLLSTALLELWQWAAAWEDAEPRGLRLLDYQQTGGVRGAVARLAEAAYTRLDAGQQERARRILLRLAGEGDVRLRVPLTDLGYADDVLMVLTADRLVTMGDGTVEVAHEALLREWPRLVSWLEEDAEGRRLHRHLTVAARDWDATGRDTGDLYRGARLAATTDWAEVHGDDINEVERDFVAASRASGEAAAEAARQTNRRLRALLSGAAGLLVFAIAAGAIAMWQRGQAESVAVIADAQRVGAEALTRERLDEAMLLARTGTQLHPSTETHSNLLAVLLRQPVILGELHGALPLYSVAVSPDRSMVAFGDEGGQVVVYDTASRRPLGETYRLPGDVVQHLVFSPDGSKLAATVHGDSTIVDVIDPRTGTLAQRFELRPFPEPADFILVTVVFHPNGEDLIAQQTDVARPAGPPSVLSRLDMATGEVVGPTRPVGRSNAWNLVRSVDPPAVYVTSPRDDRTYELDPDSLRVRRTWPAGGYSAAVTPDNRLLALVSTRGVVRTIDLATGRTRMFTGRHEDAEEPRIAIAPDGRSIVTGGAAGDVVVWDVERGAIRERLISHTDRVTSLAITDDSATLFSVAGDARVLMWDLAGDRRLDRRFDAGPTSGFEDPSPKGLDVSPDGSTIAVAQIDGTVDLIDGQTLQAVGTLQGPPLGLLAVAFSPDGRLLATTGDGGHVQIWDVVQRRRLRTIKADEGVFFAQSLLFAADGKTIAVAELPDGVTTHRGHVRLWDVASGESRPFNFPLATPALALSPDGRLLAAAGIESPSEVRDLRTGEVVAKLETGDNGRSVAFSPDGQLLAVGHYDGTAVVLSTRDFKQVGRQLAGHRARVTALEFSPDSERLLTGSVDGTVRLWDVATQGAIGAPLTTEPNTYVAATFTPDGSHVVAVPHEGRGVLWDVREASWREHACTVAGRSFTPAEWQAEVPGRHQVEVCPSR